MPKINNQSMRYLGELLLQSELKKMYELDTSKIKYKSLSKKQIKKLSEKINYLPDEYGNILFYSYCFNHTFSEIDEVLETKESDLKFLYIKNLLSSVMNLGDSWIDDESMEKACEIALEESIKEFCDIGDISVEEDSIDDYEQNSIYIKKKDIKRIFALIAKNAAIIIFVCLAGLSGLMLVNAEVRENIFSWVVEVFPQYSSFSSKNENMDSHKIDLSSFKINYIPEEFELVETNELRNMLIYNYISKNGDKLDIKLIHPDRKAYINTENAVVEEIFFKGEQAFLWNTDEIINLIWHQDDIDFGISANLSIGKDKVIKIAENITK